jgi:hypothetical protein
MSDNLYCLSASFIGDYYHSFDMPATNQYLDEAVGSFVKKHL